jgi:hypothetical protein
MLQSNRALLEPTCPHSRWRYEIKYTHSKYNYASCAVVGCSSRPFHTELDTYRVSDSLTLPTSVIQNVFVGNVFREEGVMDDSGA